MDLKMNESQSSEFTCAFCLEFQSDNADNDYFVSTECGHIFHFICISASFDSGHKECPLCRESLDLDNLRRLFGIQPKQSESIEVFKIKYDYKFKIIIVGDSGVGKSSLLKRYTDDVYHSNIFTTVGCDWRSKTVEIGGKVCSLSIWDTVGQERHRSLVTNYVRGAHGVLLVYDICDRNSFESLPHWLKFVEDYSFPDSVKILVGNKADMEGDSRKVKKDEGKSFGSKSNLPFFETSAKEAFNVEAAFRTLTAQILESESLLEEVESRRRAPPIKLRSLSSSESIKTPFRRVCSSSWHWTKAGYSGTVSKIRSGWRYLTTKTDQTGY